MATNIIGKISVFGCHTFICHAVILKWIGILKRQWALRSALSLPTSCENLRFG